MELALPFALVGAAPFIAVGRPLEAALAALAMFAAGASLRDRVSWQTLGCATAVAGGIAGMLVGAFTAGVILGMVAMFPLRLVAWAADGGHARRGSVLDGADLRQAFSVAAVLTSVVPAPLLPFARVLPGLPLLFAVGALVLVAVAVADVLSLRALARLAAEAATGELAPLQAVQRDVPVVDVGVGDRQIERREPGSAYRGRPTVLSVVRGDVKQAQGRLGRRLALDGALVALVGLLAAAANGLVRIPMG
jgi:hypothetical protein